MHKSPDPVNRNDFDAALRPGFRRSTQSAYNALNASQELESLGRLDASGRFRPELLLRRACPVCAADRSGEPLLRKLGLEVVRCARCDMVYSRTVLAPDADRKFYEATAFQADYLQLKRNDDYAGLERLKARYIMQEALRVAPQARSLLEIGSGSGCLLSAAGDAGLSVLGVEANPGFAAESRNQGHEVLEGWFPDALASRREAFDVVAMIDVLEHCIDPAKVLRMVAARLAAGGIAVVQVPNFDSLLVRLEGEASSVICHGHWNYFTPATLTRCAAAAGFACLHSETIISEADRIAAFAPLQVSRTALEMCGQSPPQNVPDAEWLHARGMGYKVFACYRVALEAEA